MVVKSGTDFRDLSELILELEEAPPGSVRRKVIKTINGKQFNIVLLMRTTTAII